MVDERRRFWEAAFCAAFTSIDIDSATAAACADDSLKKWEKKWGPEKPQEAETRVAELSREIATLRLALLEAQELLHNAQKNYTVNWAVVDRVDAALAETE